jgi:hypothetical protein
MNDQYYAWYTMQKIIGNASLWPADIRRLFWTPNLEDWQLVMICAFAFVNGLKSGCFFEWVEINKLCQTEIGMIHLRAMAGGHNSGGTWNKDVRNIFAYNVSLNKYQTLNGEVFSMQEFLEWIDT